VGNVRRRLEGKGVIRRRKDVPWWMPYTEEYPLEVREDSVPAVEGVRDPRLKEIYPAASVQDRTVPPVRLVRDPDTGWSVQCVPVVRGDGVPQWVAASPHRLVWCVPPAPDDRSWAFSVHRRQKQVGWSESHTVEELWTKPTAPHRLRLTPGLRVLLTDMIATAIGVDPIHDLTRVEHD
jgi:hypothetical protein